MSDNVRRDYNLSDAKAMEYFGQVIDAARLDVAELSAINPAITNSQIDAFDERVNIIRKFPSDDVIIDRMAERTEAVNEKMAEANSVYKRIKYYVQLAYKDKKARQNELGVNDFEKARKSQERMISFLDDLTLTIGSYRADLQAVGAPAETLNRVAPLADELNTANRAQERYKQERKRLTAQRIQAYNELYQESQEYNEAAKMAFEDAPEKLSAYTVPYTKYEGYHTEEATVPADGALVLTSEAKSGTELFVENLGSLALSYALHNTSDTQADGGKYQPLPGNGKVNLDGADATPFLHIRNGNGEGVAVVFGVR